jgi:5'-methylthioadenosine phosphorylase
MPEAKLAREAEICYALVALVTDYDCWRPSDPGKPRDSLLQEILHNLHRAGASAHQLIREAVRRAEEPAVCPCREALQLAIWTSSDWSDFVRTDKLEPLLRRRFADEKRNANQ